MQSPWLPNASTSGHKHAVLFCHCIFTKASRCDSSCHMINVLRSHSAPSHKKALAFISPVVMPWCCNAMVPLWCHYLMVPQCLSATLVHQPSCDHSATMSTMSLLCLAARSTHATATHPAPHQKVIHLQVHKGWLVRLHIHPA
eukprot:1144524-Pelagomonas_calceolata.AAC.3